MFKRILAIALLCALWVGFGVPSVAAPATQGEATFCIPEVLIGGVDTSDLSSDIYYAIDGDFALVGYTGKQSEIFVYQFSTGLRKKITNHTTNILGNSISGDYITFQHYNPEANAVDVFLYRISTGQTKRLTNSSKNDYFASVDGDYVAWWTLKKRPNKFNLKVYQISTGQTKTIPKPAGMKILGDVIINHGRVIWPFMPTNEPEFRVDIAYYDLATGSITHAGLPPMDYSVITGIDGDYIALLDGPDVYAGEGGDVLLYNINTQELKPLTNDPSVYDSFPRLNNNYLTWTRFDGQDNELVLYDINSDMTTTLTNNATNDLPLSIQGDYIAAVDFDFNFYQYQISAKQFTPVAESIAPRPTLDEYWGSAVDGNMIYTGYGMHDIYVHRAGVPRNCVTNLLQNPSFENGMTGWKPGEGLTEQDNVACHIASEDPLYGFHKQCGFAFVNDVDKLASFSQTVKFEDNPLPKGHALNLYAWVSPVKNVTQPGRLKVDIWYKNGKKDNLVLPFPVFDAIGYTQISGNLPLKRPVSKLRVTVINQSRRYTTRVDNIIAYVGQPDALISVPPPPNDYVTSQSLSDEGKQSVDLCKFFVGEGNSEGVNGFFNGALRLNPSANSGACARPRM